MKARPGSNIPLNLPIIQIIILHLSTLLFKRKLPNKMQMNIMDMTRMYNYAHFGQQVLIQNFMQIFSLL